MIEDIMNNLPPIIRKFMLSKGTIKDVGNKQVHMMFVFNDKSEYIGLKSSLDKTMIHSEPIISITLTTYHETDFYVLNNNNVFIRNPEKYITQLDQYKLVQTVKGKQDKRQMILAYVERDLVHIITPAICDIKKVLTHLEGERIQDD